MGGTALLSADKRLAAVEADRERLALGQAGNDGAIQGAVARVEFFAGSATALVGPALTRIRTVDQRHTRAIRWRERATTILTGQELQAATEVEVDSPAARRLTFRAGAIIVWPEATLQPLDLMPRAGVQFAREAIYVSNLAFGVKEPLAALRRAVDTRAACAGLADWHGTDTAGGSGIRHRETSIEQRF